MKHLAVVQSEFLKIAVENEWNNLSIEQQRDYLRRHPKSKRKITAKPKDELKNKLEDKRHQLNKKYDVYDPEVSNDLPKEGQLVKVGDLNFIGTIKSVLKDTYVVTNGKQDVDAIHEDFVKPNEDEIDLFSKGEQPKSVQKKKHSGYKAELLSDKITIYDPKNGVKSNQIAKLGDKHVKIINVAGDEATVLNKDGEKQKVNIKDLQKPDDSSFDIWTDSGYVTFW